MIEGTEQLPSEAKAACKAAHRADEFYLVSERSCLLDAPNRDPQILIPVAEVRLRRVLDDHMVLSSAFK